MSHKSLIIGFIPATDNGLSFRGSEASLKDYAYHNEKLLGNKSIICLGKTAYNEPIVLDEFKRLFSTFIYFDSTDDLERQLGEHKVDAVYMIRSGKRQEPMLKSIAMIIHAVYDMSEPHGLVMAAVSQSVAEKFGSSLYVPHMVTVNETREDYRETLGIPKDAIVFGRHGGRDTFDLPFVKEVILRLLKERDDVYFLFAVRPQIFQDVAHPRLICLECFYDPKVKRKFLNTLSFFLHAQSLGETFGISIAEASQARIPIITWNGGTCQEHLRILGDRCIKYNDAQHLYTIMTTVDPVKSKANHLKSYDEYLPGNIMPIFNSVFLDPVRRLEDNQAQCMPG